MATFVHLTPAANGDRISRSGVAARSVGRIPGDERRGVYLFPVQRDHVATHQWARELVRTHGRRRVVAVQVCLPDVEPVTIGRFDGVATASTAADAVARIGELIDPRGWEVFLPRAISVAEVRHVRELRRPVGWRHVPDAHGTAPCTCRGCRVPGTFGAARLLERRPDPVDGPGPGVPVLLARLESVDSSDVTAILDVLDGFGGRRRGPVERLAHLAEHPDPQVRAALVWTVAGWSTPGARPLVERLASDPDDEVREAAAAWSAGED
ncbi:HEAT repeat domain-containing protein [Oerskovia gallyi]|uniref:HEAT repeat domain-containing protein n=1 Tax=Oerskovia gallyi TaxID=2762226 RepID=A0ABR8V6W2_9CELL|nr:HEAT repeat domain-containing protein [Oerskovia gallyi]MBD8000051.1 HEAT repeat domain-containing protein [Oerskovia gallyi]